MTMRTRGKVTEENHIGHFLWFLRLLWLHVCNRDPFLPLQLLQEMVSEAIPLLINCAKPGQPIVFGTYAPLYHKHL